MKKRPLKINSLTAEHTRQITCDFALTSVGSPALHSFSHKNKTRSTTAELANLAEFRPKDTVVELKMVEIYTKVHPNVFSSKGFAFLTNSTTFQKN